MGIGGAVIYSLIVMAIREIATAVRWAWRAYLDGAALYGASYHGMLHVMNEESRTQAVPDDQLAVVIASSASDVESTLPQPQPKNPQCSAPVLQAANDADGLRELAA